MKIRISLSVLSFKDRAIKTWGLEEWKGIDDPDKDIVFFGLFNDRDFAVFESLKQKKWVFWCGTDILRVLEDYERIRILKNHSDTEHYCENEVEQKNLKRVGIESKIVPSFLDNINNYPISYKHSKNPHIYLCGHDEREEEYGVGLVKRIANRVKEATFHIYGIDRNSSYFGNTELSIDKLIDIDMYYPNIWYHGKVPEGQFNNEIMTYQCGLRPNDHDGFSEVTSKGIIMGQYPITKIPYEGIWNYNTDDELIALIEKLKYMKEPNNKGRSLYLKKINKFPWCDEKIK